MHICKTDILKGIYSLIDYALLYNTVDIPIRPSTFTLTMSFTGAMSFASDNTKL